MINIEEQLLNKEAREAAIDAALRGYQCLATQFREGQIYQGSRIGFENGIYDLFNSGYMRAVKSCLLKIDRPLLGHFEDGFAKIVQQIRFA